MKKYILMFIFVIFIIFFTLYNVCSANTFKVMLDSIDNMNLIYIFILFLVIFLYFILQGVYMKIILGSLNKKISLLKGMFYSIVEFYFSGITPSSTGGQPVQLYFMTKDKIPIRKSYITLILNTVFFKITILLLGLWVLIFHNNYVFSNSTFYIVFFIIGLLSDILLIVTGLLLLFYQKLLRKIFKGLVKIGKKIPFFRKKAEEVDVDEIITRYMDQIKYIKGHKIQVLITFVITFIQRLLLFSVAYIVYRALGLNSFSYFELLAIQVSMHVTIELFPLPGGTGLSENMLKDIFITVFGIGLAESGMIFTRLFSYYIPLLVSGIIIVVYYLYKKIKTREY